MPRPERMKKRVAGMGGHMQIYHKRLVESPGGDSLVPVIAPGILDVGRWEILHRQITVEVTCSGSLGAIKRACVARDWRFRCACAWNARYGTRDHHEVLLGFLEQILTGHLSTDYSLGLRFYLGDPLNYGELDSVEYRYHAYLAAPLAVAENFRTVCDAMGKDVVRIDFEGAGNSLLEGWRGPNQAFPLADTMRPLYN